MVQTVFLPHGVATKAFSKGIHTAMCCLSMLGYQRSSCVPNSDSKAMPKKVNNFQTLQTVGKYLNMPSQNEEKNIFNGFLKLSFQQLCMTALHGLEVVIMSISCLNSSSSCACSLKQ